MLSILLLAWLGCVVQVGVQTFALFVIGKMGWVMSRRLLMMGLGIAFLSLFFYGFHIFLHLNFGIGVSIFCGVFESLQMVVYSNISLKGPWQYIPFAWMMEWKASVLDGRIEEEFGFWAVCMFLLCFALCLLFSWFEQWEGKRNHGE